MLRKHFAAVGAAVIVALIGAEFLRAEVTGRSAGDTPTEKAAAGDSGTAATDSQSQSTATPSQLTDKQISAWLRAQYDLHIRVSEFAAKHASNDEVRQFARNAGQGHMATIARLTAPAGPQADDSEFDFADTLEQIAQRIRERRDDMQSEGQRQVLGFRGVSDVERQDLKGTRQTLRDEIDALSEQIRELRQEVRQDRRDVRAARPERDRRSDEEADNEAEGEPTPSALDVAQKKLSETQDELRDVRQQRRESFRELARTVIPVLRDNLPQILDTVSEAVEKAGSARGPLIFTSLDRQVSEQLAGRICSELQQKEGGEFDHAYLGFEMATQLRLVESLKAAMPHASAKYRSALNAQLLTAQTDLDRARELLHEVGSSEG